jgi:hypothetical protein
VNDVIVNLLNSKCFKHLPSEQLHRSSFMDHVPFLIFRRSEFIHTGFRPQKGTKGIRKAEKHFVSLVPFVAIPRFGSRF